MALTLKPAVKSQSKLRLALAGPAGSGKTFSSLVLACVLAEGGLIVVIDTEHGRAAKYGSDFAFSVIELETFAPASYLEALAIAHDAGAKVVIIDSLSHAWNGEGGILEIVDVAARQSRTNDKFNAGWGVGTPQHNKLINAIQRAPSHVIATMRSKIEYSQERGPDGKMKIVKQGTIPVQREGVDYEFDIFGMLDREHQLLIEKSICRTVPVGALLPTPDAALGHTILAWLNEGPAAPIALTPPHDPATPPSTTPADPAPHTTTPNSTEQHHATTASPATDRQRAAIGKLCAALRRQPPDQLETITFGAARDLLTTLSADYKDTRGGAA